MKKAIHIGVIILIIFGLCLTEQLLLKNFYGEMRAQTERVELLSNDWENNTSEIVEEIDALEDLWKEKSMTLWTFISHKEMRELGIEISRLKTAAKEENFDLFYESLNLVFYYIETYQNLAEINLQNIF